MDRPIHLLHVDDEPGFADLATTYLERESGRITASTALNAAAAREQIEAGPPDCIVSDYDMPGADGLQLLETVRELDARLPFVLYTGEGSETIASDAISAGVTDCLQKQGGGRSEYAVLANRIENAEGAYPGYVGVEEQPWEDWATQAYGDRLDRVRELAATYDPDGVFASHVDA